MLWLCFTQSLVIFTVLDYQVYKYEGTIIYLSNNHSSNSSQETLMRGALLLEPHRSEPIVSLK